MAETGRRYLDWRCPWGCMPCQWGTGCWCAEDAALSATQTGQNDPGGADTTGSP